MCEIDFENFNEKDFVTFEISGIENLIDSEFILARMKPTLENGYDEKDTEHEKYQQKNSISHDYGNLMNHLNEKSSILIEPIMNESLSIIYLKDKVNSLLHQMMFMNEISIIERLIDTVN